MSDAEPSMSDARQEYLSRRERRQFAREQKGGGGSPRWVRRALLWGGFVVVLALIGWGMVALSGSTRLPSELGALVDPVTDADHILGPADAPVTLVEYSDFQCPACAAFAPVVKQALAEPALAGKVRLVYRAFPLTNIHPNATLSARAAEAAALQGKFWEMHDKLFDGQLAWTKLSDDKAREVFKGYASDLGLDIAAFTEAIDSSGVKDAVRAQSDSAERSNVTGTPTFFINGSKMAQVRSYEEFKQNLLDAANANP